MTRKDYEAIAAKFAIDRPKDGPALEMYVALQKRIADAFALDNPRFNRQRFYDACEPRAW